MQMNCLYLAAEIVPESSDSSALNIQLVCEVNLHSCHILISPAHRRRGETKMKRAGRILMPARNHLHQSDGIIHGVSK